MCHASTLNSSIRAELAGSRGPYVFWEEWLVKESSNGLDYPFIVHYVSHIYSQARD